MLWFYTALVTLALCSSIIPLVACKLQEKHTKIKYVFSKELLNFELKYPRRQLWEHMEEKFERAEEYSQELP